MHSFSTQKETLFATRVVSICKHLRFYIKTHIYIYMYIYINVKRERQKFLGFDPALRQRTNESLYMQLHMGVNKIAVIWLTNSCADKQATVYACTTQERKLVNCWVSYMLMQTRWILLALCPPTIFTHTFLGGAFGGCLCSITYLLVFLKATLFAGEMLHCTKF